MAVHERGARCAVRPQHRTSCADAEPQVHFGAAWPYPFGAIVQAKVTDAQTVRKIALEGHRFTPQEAVKFGFVDELVQGDTEAVLNKALELGKKVGEQAQSGVWGVIRVSLSLARAHPRHFR